MSNRSGRMDRLERVALENAAKVCPFCGREPSKYEQMSDEDLDVEIERLYAIFGRLRASAHDPIPSALEQGVPR